MINLHFKDYEEFGMNPQHTSGKHRLQQHKQKLQQSPHQQSGSRLFDPWLSKLRQSPRA